MGAPRSSLELQGTPRSSMELHGAPWSSGELQGAPWLNAGRGRRAAAAEAAGAGPARRRWRAGPASACLHGTTWSKALASLGANPSPKMSDLLCPLALPTSIY